MAGDQDDSDDKPFEATQKRLDDARRKGEVPQSADLSAAAAFGGLILTGAALGSGNLTSLGAALSAFLANPVWLSDALVTGRFADAAGPEVQAVAAALWSWFAIPALAVVAMVIAQRAFVIAPSRLRPRAERISPLAGARRKFGRGGLFEFAKSAVKLILISACLFGFCLWRLPVMLAAQALDSGQVVVLTLRLALEFLSAVFALTLTLGGLDAVWQWAEHSRKHRMSRKELADETKESEGDPWLKSRRRDRGTEIATNRMMAEVPKADVVIVNPAHYAIALKWTRHAGAAPVCVAKGVDETAARIRAAAAEAGVPIHRDPPTARALYGLVALGAEIPPEQYRAVAVAIRFADAVRARARARNGG